jgi:hypothetical protein
MFEVELSDAKTGKGPDQDNPNDDPENRSATIVFHEHYFSPFSFWRH